MAFDKDLLETLTPEERAAVTDEEYSEDELASMKGVGDDDDEDDDDNLDSAAPPAEGKQEPKDAPAESDPKQAEAAPAADAKKVEAEATEEEEAEFRPRYQSQLPEDFKGQVDALNTEMRELAQQFKDGDVDFDDYNAKLLELNSRRDELNVARAKAEISSEMSQQTAQQEWEFTIKTFTRRVAKTEGIDYSKDTEKQTDLDDFVKRLAQNPANNDKEMEWFLVEAHKRVKALHGIASETSPAAPKQTSRKPPLDAAPKTLAQVPGSDGPGDLAGEFADIDKLSGDAYEAALRKMSPDQLKRFEMGM